jgi:hypothetical protein
MNFKLGCKGLNILSHCLKSIRLVQTWYGYEGKPFIQLNFERTPRQTPH